MKLIYQKYEKFFKKHLQFLKLYAIITLADLCDQINLYKITLARAGFLEVSKWLSAVSAVRALPSDTTCLTPTARPTEPGSPISVRLRLLLTELILLFPFAPVAFVPERSSALKGLKKLCLNGRVF